LGGSLWSGAILAIGVASVANTLVFALAGALGVALRVSLTPGRPPQPLALGMVVFATAVSALLAAGLLGLLGRLTDRPVRLFQNTSIVLALLSLGAPLLQADGSAATIVLVVMHLVAAAAIVGVLSMVARRA
jgi:hypothetical protein